MVLLCLQCGRCYQLRYFDGQFLPLEDTLDATGAFVGFEAEQGPIKFRREDTIAERDVAKFLADEFDTVDPYLSSFFKAYLGWACGSDEDLPHYDPANAVGDLFN